MGYSERLEGENVLRTVECLRGRLMAGRASSRNTREETDRLMSKSYQKAVLVDPSYKPTANCSTNSMSAYHKREIFEGPYQIKWPLPANVNKDNISAELA